jgi:hypothetical protein
MSSFSFQYKYITRGSIKEKEHLNNDHISPSDILAYINPTNNDELKELMLMIFNL